MAYSIRIASIIVLCLLVTGCFISCEKTQKVGTLQITETEFILEQDNKKTTISLNVRGKIKNTGFYDIKGIVVTGRCNKCSEVMNPGHWFVTQQEKQDSQKDTLNYLVAGAEESFSFDGIAYFFRSKAAEIPGTYPDGLEVYVESFETVQE